MLPPTFPSDEVASVASDACPGVESKERTAEAAAAAASALPSAGPRVGELVLGGPLLF